MLQRPQWRRSPRVMGRGAVLGWGCGELAPLPLRGSSRAALPGRSARAPACAHLNPAAPGALTLRGGGDQRQRRGRRVFPGLPRGNLMASVSETVDPENGAPSSPPRAATSLFPCFHEGQRLQKHGDRPGTVTKLGCGSGPRAGKWRAGLLAESLPAVPRRRLGEGQSYFLELSQDLGCYRREKKGVAGLRGEVIGSG